MGKVLVVCSTHRDHRELKLIPEAREHTFLFHDYDDLDLENFIDRRRFCSTPLVDLTEEIDRILSICQKERIRAVISTDDYPGSALASIVCERLKLVGLSVKTSLICQHKFYSRKIQESAAPEAVCRYELLNPNGNTDGASKLVFPFFVKPVKSFFSLGAYRIQSRSELIEITKWWSSMEEFFRPYQFLLDKYAGFKTESGSFIAEELAYGFQGTLEGYVFQGKVYFLGIVDSIFIPGTISFHRFEYPSSLSGAVQERMFEIARKVLRYADYNHGFFNMEFIYNPETDHLKIIEINPRMSSQFADLFEKVDGTNSYRILLDLAFNKKPVIVQGKGKHKMAASCILRTLNNRIVLSIPKDEQIDRLQAIIPDIRIEVLATPGRKLSEQIQDSCTYRYGIVSMGGRDRKDILESFDLSRRMLNFVLLPLS